LAAVDIDRLVTGVTCQLLLLCFMTEITLYHRALGGDGQINQWSW